MIPGLGRSPGERYGNPLCILAWEIPWTEEPDGLQSMGSQRVDTTEQSTLVLLPEKEAAIPNLVQFSHSVVSDSLRPHELQHTRLPCPSPTPGSRAYILNSLMTFKTNQPIHVSVGHNLFYPPSLNIISLGTSGLSQVTELSLRQDWYHFT